MADIEIRFHGPMDLNGYDCSLPASQQPSFPAAFLDAMKVRETVFVNEQGVPIVMEADTDDGRSYHWIAYNKKKPVGYIRLVPFPHEPHPEPGWAWVPDETTKTLLVMKAPPYIIDRETSLHDGKEPYMKFGRLAVVKEGRGKGIADMLVNAAVEWAKHNPVEGWNGLVCAHAQEYLAKFWGKHGFEIDEDMGKWTEAGIPHVGMFLRVEVVKPF